MRDQQRIRILILNLHGLVKGGGLEIGRDADNGGQTRYVHDVAHFLSRHQRVRHVDLFTRLIDDDGLDDAYGVPVELLSDRLTIHRIPFGGKRYRMKEELWPFLDDFVAGALHHIREQDIVPDWIHSHYADAGYAAVQLSRLLNIPFAHTGHSLGRRKLEKLLESGMSPSEAERRFRFSSRIAAEESTLRRSAFVVTSTEDEIATYSDYEEVDAAQFRVLPPGVDTDKFAPFYQVRVDTDGVHEQELQRLYWVGEDIERFLNNPQKPAILALSRPDRHKNLPALLKVYGESRALQSLANLVVYAGIRKDIEGMPAAEREVLVEILLLMDRYDLYGKLAIPKKHDVENEVASIYRYCAEKRGVLVNLALHENFGLTLIEAASSGLPVVSTRNGGPSEVIPTCENGRLVDPRDEEAVRLAMLDVLTDADQWRRFSERGILNVRRHYSWKTHVDQYVEWVRASLHESHPSGPAEHTRLSRMRRLLVTDIDGTLIHQGLGHPGLDDLRVWLSARPKEIGFGLASGRSFELVLEAIDKYRIPPPDFLICSVGTQIHYYTGREYIADLSWQTHLDRTWDRGRLERLLRSVPWITPQGPEGQNPHKLSYHLVDGRYDEDDLRLVLGRSWKHVTVIPSHGAYLDILPRRASKGKALRYLASKWAISSRDVLAAGDSGNDLDMLAGSVLGIVVSNRSDELADLAGGRSLFHASRPAAAGIIEGMSHYGWLPVSQEVSA